MPARPAPRVLLASLEPILGLGMKRVLAEQGIDVVGQEQDPEAVVVAAARLGPDAVVLGGGAHAGAELGRRLQAAAPAAKLVFWSGDGGALEVLDPGQRAPRRIRADAARELGRELIQSRANPEE